VLAIDPIDGTREYRDRTGHRYAVMLHLRTQEAIHYSLVFLPEEGAGGTWLEVRDDRIVLGPDDCTVAARPALDALQPIPLNRHPESRRILVSGFLGRETERARAVSAAGLEGVLGGDTPGSLFPLMASGYLGGALYHTPNVYDFPVCMHIARVFGGDAVWVHDGKRVDFRRMWRDERANMFRLPGIVACASDPTLIPTLIDVARQWSAERYQ
jgi:3'(2'), 5'-bisphosphate nucleotidase